MINFDKDSLECDLAETYHIYEMKELPLKKVALFSVGLRNNSRIKTKMMGLNQTFETTLLAKITDELSISNWIKAGAKKEQKPNLILPKLLGVIEKENKENKENVGFDTVEEFEKERKAILESVVNIDGTG